MIALVFWGWIGVILYHIFPQKTNYRLFTIGSLSLLFLYYVTHSLLVFSSVVLWIALVHAASYFIQKKWIYQTYIAAVIALFVSFKLGLFTTGDHNILLENALPVGFSFIMFHSLALLFDRANKVIEQPVKFGRYMTSALFFPTLLIGPFHKFTDFQNSLNSNYLYKRSIHGYCLFCMGLFKFAFSGIFLKTNFLYSIPLTEQQATASLRHPFTIMLILSFYLYTNFSGFSDIVVGLAKMMGFDVPLNFKFPFFSCSMAEYWRNWHITLGAWFREYFFLPLNYRLAKMKLFKSTQVTTKLSVFVTFLLIGLWHQLSLKMLAYSIINALLVVFLFPKGSTTRWISWPVTFFAVLCINALFLSDSVGTFIKLMESFYTNSATIAEYTNPRTLRNILFAVVSLLAIYLCEKLIDRLSDYNKDIDKKIIAANFVVCIILLFFGITLGLSGVNAVYVGY